MVKSFCENPLIPDLRILANDQFPLNTRTDRYAQLPTSFPIVLKGRSLGAQQTESQMRKIKNQKVGGSLEGKTVNGRLNCWVQCLKRTSLIGCNWSVCESQIGSHWLNHHSSLALLTGSGKKNKSWLIQSLVVFLTEPFQVKRPNKTHRPDWETLSGSLRAGK